MLNSSISSWLTPLPSSYHPICNLPSYSLLQTLPSLIFLIPFQPIDWFIVLEVQLSEYMAYSRVWQEFPLSLESLDRGTSLRSATWSWWALFTSALTLRLTAQSNRPFQLIFLFISWPGKFSVTQILHCSGEYPGKHRWFYAHDFQQLVFSLLIAETFKLCPEGHMQPAKDTYLAHRVFLLPLTVLF